MNVTATLPVGMKTDQEEELIGADDRNKLIDISSSQLIVKKGSVVEAFDGESPLKGKVRALRLQITAAQPTPSRRKK